MQTTYLFIAEKYILTHELHFKITFYNCRWSAYWLVTYIALSSYTKNIPPSYPHTIIMHLVSHYVWYLIRVINYITLGWLKHIVTISKYNSTTCIWSTCWNTKTASEEFDTVPRMSHENSKKVHMHSCENLKTKRNVMYAFSFSWYNECYSNNLNQLAGNSKRLISVYDIPYLGIANIDVTEYHTAIWKKSVVTFSRWLCRSNAL